MKRTLLSLIAHWAGGEIHGDDVAIDAVSHDTRSLGPGSLYVALRGERFDGHDFAADAQARGASALLVERLLPIELPQVLVADSELALAKIATGMQRDRGTEVFAITGSNGKTSVKSLLLSILQQVAQRDFGVTPTYEVIEEAGPDHSKSFHIAAQIGGRSYSPAWGRNKKEAEQRAASNALSELQPDHP